MFLCDNQGKFSTFLIHFLIHFGGKAWRKAIISCSFTFPNFLIVNRSATREPTRRYRFY